jgi:hypothetical protein
MIRVGTAVEVHRTISGPVVAVITPSGVLLGVSEGVKVAVGVTVPVEVGGAGV